MSNGAPPPTRLDRLVTFVERQHDYYASYHNHKEGMAYAGFTVYAGIVGAAIFSSGWPPHWGVNSRVWAVVAASALWLLSFSFLRFQLRRRRWAAIRRAGCERLLARWLVEPPQEDALAALPAPVERPIASWISLLDYFVPQRAAVQAIETDQTIYPTVLAREWVAREVTGSQAIIHERLLIIAGWILYVALVARAIVA